jgi:hypothetical protein
MPCLQRCLISLFSFLAITVLIPFEALADGMTLNPAVGSVTAGCSFFGGNAAIAPVSTAATTPQYTTTTSCDLSTALPDGQSLQATGTALATLGLSPAADVTAHASDSGYDPNVTPNYPNADISATLVSEASFSVSVNLTALPTPHPAEDGIPVLMTWTGDKNVTGSGYAQIDAWFQGVTSYTPGVLTYTFAPGEQYGANVEAICYAEAYQNSSSDCQAVADPTFTFDQATFDAEMGSNTFPLADYYSFEFSPNLTATPPPSVPEPSSLLLLGTGLLALIGLALKKTSL